MLYHNSVSNLRVGLYGSYSTLSPVVHGDIALSINTNKQKQKKHTGSCLGFYKQLLCLIPHSISGKFCCHTEIKLLLGHYTPHTP